MIGSGYHVLLVPNASVPRRVLILRPQPWFPHPQLRVISLTNESFALVPRYAAGRGHDDDDGYELVLHFALHIRRGAVGIMG